MTAKKTKPASPPARNDVMKVYATEGDNVALQVAKSIVAPDFRHGLTVSQIHKVQFGTMEDAPGLGDFADAIRATGKAAESGELACASRMRAAQAMTLDSIFTEMARRMALNMGEHLSATEIYARTALKAQAGCRATLEALAKLHQPREQTVRHVHVNEGGQAVIADQFHNHTGGQEIGKSGNQPQATGTGAAGASPALPCPDPLGGGVPVASREGQAKVPDARGAVTGRAEGQP